MIELPLIKVNDSYYKKISQFYKGSTRLFAKSLTKSQLHRFSNFYDVRAIVDMTSKSNFDTLRSKETKLIRDNLISNMFSLNIFGFEKENTSNKIEVDIFDRQQIVAAKQEFNFFGVIRIQENTDFEADLEKPSFDGLVEEAEVVEEESDD